MYLDLALASRFPAAAGDDHLRLLTPRPSLLFDKKKKQQQ